MLRKTRVPRMPRMPRMKKSMKKMLLKNKESEAAGAGTSFLGQLRRWVRPVGPCRVSAAAQVEWKHHLDETQKKKSQDALTLPMHLQRLPLQPPRRCRCSCCRSTCNSLAVWETSCRLAGG